MKKLGLKLLLLTFLVLLVVVTTDFIYRKVHRYEYPQVGALWYAPAIKDKYQLVNVGNSHALAAMKYQGYKVKSLNLASVAQRFSFDLVALKQHQNEIADHAVILIDVSHLSFSHRKADRNDGLQYNSYGGVAPFLIPDLKVSDYLQIQIFPFLRAGYLWRRNHADIVKERIAKEERVIAPTPAPKPIVTINTPTPTTTTQKSLRPITMADNPLSVAAIYSELSHHSSISADSYIDNMNFIFNKWYHTDEFDPKYFATNRQDLEKLIAFCLEKNWRPVLMTTPVTQILEDGLLTDYKQTYLYDNLAKTNLQGVEYIDLSTRKDFTTDNFLFGNADHLNDNGGVVYSYLMLQELIQRGYLPPDADGYDYKGCENNPLCAK